MQNEKELAELKRLLILLLIKLGATSEELSIALQVDASAIRRTFPTKKIKKILDTRGD